MAEYGLVTSVQWLPRTSELTAPAPVGALVLSVESPVDFDEDGGQLDLNGVRYDYDAADHDLSTIALSTPVTVAADVDDLVAAVMGGQVAIDYVAFATLGEGDDIEVLIPYAERDLWAEGVYDDPVPVVLSDDLTRIVDVPARTPERDGGFIADGTAPSGPTIPPPPPALSLYGLSRGFNLSVTNGIPGSEYAVEVYVAGVLQGSYPVTSRSTIYVDTLPSGGAFDPAVIYTFGVTASNELGVASASTSGQLRLEDSTTIAELSVDKLRSGVVNAAMVLAGMLAIGLITLDEDQGLVIPQPDGGKIQLPADGSPATMDSYVIARGLSATQGALFAGLVQMLGTLRLGAGVTDPTDQATAAFDVPSLATDLDDSTKPIMRGLTTHATDANVLVSAVSAPFYGADVRAINLTTGAAPTVGASGWTLGFLPDGGITRIGSQYFVLGRDFNRNQAWYVYRLDASFAKTGEWDAGVGSPLYTPCIGTDGTNVLVANSTSATRIAVRPFSTAGVAASFTALDHNLGQQYHLGGVYRGNSDLGADRFIVATKAGPVLAFTAAGARVTADEFDRANGSTVLGLCWDGVRFHHVDDGGRVWSYDTSPRAQSTDVSYAWRDAEGVTHETRPAPVRRVTRPARRRMTITAAPAPEAGVTDPTKTDKANLIRLYAAPAGQTLRLQADLALNVRSGVIAGPIQTATKAAETANGFVGVAGGLGALAAAGGGFVVDGQSNGSIGTGTFRDSIRTLIRQSAQGGTVASGSITAANVWQKVADVTYPVSMLAAPSVVVQSQTAFSGSDSIDYRAAAVSATGCEIWAKSPTTRTAQTVAWIAVIP